MKYHKKSVSEYLLTAGMVFLIVGAASVLILSVHKYKSKQFPVPYLLLVSFYSGQMNNFGSDKIQAINESPYHGVAVPLIGAYDTGKYTEKDFETAVNRFKKESKKDILPWVFFNRFIGYKEGERSISPLANSDYFRAIKGMDIKNEAGAFEDFLNIYRTSLKTAKELGSPGIVIDPESYNNYSCYKISYLAEQWKKSEEEIKQELKNAGKQLTDIADKIYHDATLWFLFTGLTTPLRTWNPFSDKEYKSVSYIIQGMLEEAKEKKSKLKIISGGEVSLNYCFKSLGDLKERVKKRNKDFTSVLSSYPNLYLGGTISPWNKTSLKKNWMIKGKCGSSELKSINDFKPLFRHLLESYNYVWIYAAVAAEYDPYNSDIYSDYNKAISECITD